MTSDRTRPSVNRGHLTSVFSGQLTSALTLLAGLSVEGTGGFEEWLLGERERLRGLALEALAKLSAQQRGAAQTEAAIQTGLQLLGLDLLQEPMHRALIRLYAQAWRRGAALRQWRNCSVDRSWLDNLACLLGRRNWESHALGRGEPDLQP